MIVVLNKLDAVDPANATSWAEALSAVPGISAIVGYSKENLRKTDFKSLRLSIKGEGERRDHPELTALPTTRDCDSHELFHFSVKRTIATSGLDGYVQVEGGKQDIHVLLTDSFCSGKLAKSP